MRPVSLNADQVAAYRRDGFLVVRGVLSPSEVASLRRRVRDLASTCAFPPSLKYPAPGKYTVSGNQMALPGLAAVAEHPQVVGAVESLLGKAAHLTAYVAYMRTPGDKGSGAHCDYKRWRPVGSSMDWLFAIVPLVDFNDEYGPFLVSPGSHRLTRERDGGTRVRDLQRPDREALAPFVDPEAKAGDLILAHQHNWHKAPAGTSGESRCGIFNKYCAADAPPAAGYYPYDPAARAALSEAGRRLLPVCFERPPADTRLLVERACGGESAYLLLDGEAGPQLPGGAGWEEEEGVGWDVGARIGALQTLAARQLGRDIPWMSYVDDAETPAGPSRVYGYVDEAADWDVAGGAWCGRAELERRLGPQDPVCRAVAEWERADVVRGRGVAVSQRQAQWG